MPFKAEESVISKLLNDARYSIPRNQRRYVWSKQNWRELFDDVLLVVDEVTKSHFIGSIVLYEEEKEEGLSCYTIIDGQQRIITLSLLLSAIMFTFAHNNMADDFGGMMKFLIAKDIRNRNHSIVDSEYHISLRRIINNLTTTEINELSDMSITEFANECIVSKSKDALIINAFKYFCDQLKDKDVYSLKKIRDAVINIGYVNIISTSEEDSYTIFEILNARGLDLEDFELLKNYIMRYWQPEARRDEAKRVWEEMEASLGPDIKKFIKHYTIHRYEKSKNKVESDYKVIQRFTNPRDVEELLYDMKKKSEYYIRIVQPIQNDGNLISRVEFHIFSFFRKKRHEQWRPILLSLIHQKELGRLSEEQYISTLNFLYNYYVCFKIIGEENSNRLEDVTYKYAPLLENQYSDEIRLEFLTSLKNKIPGIDWFTNAFKNLGWSHHWGLYKDQKRKERVQVVLEIIEEYMSNRGLNVDVTLEHVLPDSEREDNSQIGNLILLEGNLNRKCNDKPIEEKLLIYQESTLSSARGFSQRYREKDFDPSERTKYLAKFVYNNILGLDQ